MTARVIAASYRRGPGPAARLARRALHARLAALRGGAVTLVDGDAAETFGEAGAPLQATLRVLDPRFYRAVALRGSVGAAEAWMDGHWTCDDLTALVRLVARNRALGRFDEGAARLARPGLKLLHALRRNHRAGARRNVAAHYDLGNAFFELFLDPGMTYSCAVFERPDMSLEEAQRSKYERLCRKLALRPEDRVLEIGGGWGGFAIHAARTRGCRVTSATISREQVERARARIAEAGLGDRAEMVFRDYRDLEGSFDKLVSIEMIEAVGARHLETFFRVCSERLRRDGLMALQAITVPDQDWQSSLRNVDFIKRYIFPGGQLVSLGAIARSLAAATDLRIIHLEDISPHYAETLARWRANLRRNLERLRGLGLPESFLRMWEYYLCYCEGGFRERAIGVVQMLLAKPGSRHAPALGGLA